MLRPLWVLYAPRLTSQAISYLGSSYPDGSAFVAPFFDGLRRAVPPGTSPACGTCYLCNMQP